MLSTQSEMLRERKGKAKAAAGRDLEANLCVKCNGLCCRHVAVPIDTPETAGDFDDIRWYLAHERVTVFIEDGDWYIQFKSKCRYLSRQMKCDIYPSRPKICRGYSNGDCEFSGDDAPEDMKFSKPDDIEDYAKEYLRKKYRPAKTRTKRGKSRKGSR